MRSDDSMPAAKLPTLAFTDMTSIESHLFKSNADHAGFWIKLAKKGAPKPTITKTQAIEAALCYGWIDGQLAKHDDCYFLIRMTPRRSGSRWSAINRDLAKRLIREGRMQPAGLKQIESAKADGRWDTAYRSQSKAEPSSDLLAALSSNKKAKGMFDKLDSANRYAIIYRVTDAKRPETRANRIKQYVDMLARGETIHPTRKKSATKK
jgi:uncharacterized protein YdeI (YjbR/CyaY-like superfamily)